MARERILILGAAGRDFHNFNVYFRQNDTYEVVGFTATQIPNIDDRSYPKELSGPLYPEGLPIWSENDLEKIVAEHKVERALLCYSDLNHLTVMDIASRVLATGADFGLLGPEKTYIKSKKPCIAITAVRTGCGKSQTSRYVSDLLRAAGLTPVAIRHPMPYGDLAKQAVQRFATYDDLAKHNVTIEEREEYESHINNGVVVYAGVDFQAILDEAEKEADVIIWDGGNNDLPFYKPDFWIVIADPLRPKHELLYYPGAVNFRAADIIVINKVTDAPKEGVEMIIEHAKKVNPKAKIIKAASEVIVDDPKVIEGKKVLLVDDGPTITHGEMPFGAAKVAATKYKAKEVVNPKPHAIGSLKPLFEKWTHLGETLPAMGYWDEQVEDLRKTIEAVPCEGVVIGTPMDLRRLFKIEKPATQVTYALKDLEAPFLSVYVNEWIAKIKK